MVNLKKGVETLGGHTRGQQKVEMFCVLVEETGWP